LFVVSDEEMELNQTRIPLQLNFFIFKSINPKFVLQFKASIHQSKYLNPNRSYAAL
jgi:hypothetical protein